MRPGLLRLFSGLRCLMTRGDGQDLVEYGLVIGMLALTLTASSQTFAVVITTTFNNLATGFTNAV